MEDFPSLLPHFGSPGLRQGRAIRHCASLSERKAKVWSSYVRCYSRMPIHSAQDIQDDSGQEQ
jgi:hypothetical protein